MLNADAADRTASGTVLGFPDTPEARLRRALRGLDQALAEQRAAVLAFRAQIRDLDQAVSGLGLSAEGLRGALDAAAAETERAEAAARSLAATARVMERFAPR